MRECLIDREYLVKYFKNELTTFEDQIISTVTDLIEEKKDSYSILNAFENTPLEHCIFTFQYFSKKETKSYPKNILEEIDGFELDDLDTCILRVTLPTDFLFANADSPLEFTIRLDQKSFLPIAYEQVLHEILWEEGYFAFHLIDKYCDSLENYMAIKTQVVMQFLQDNYFAFWNTDESEDIQRDKFVGNLVKLLKKYRHSKSLIVTKESYIQDDLDGLENCKSFALTLQKRLVDCSDENILLAELFGASDTCEADYIENTDGFLPICLLLEALLCYLGFKLDLSFSSEQVFNFFDILQKSRKYWIENVESMQGIVILNQDMAREELLDRVQDGAFNSDEIEYLNDDIGILDFVNSISPSKDAIIIQCDLL